MRERIGGRLTPRTAATNLLVDLEERGFQFILTANGFRVQGRRRVMTQEFELLVYAHVRSLTDILRDRAAFEARGKAEWTCRGGRWVRTPEDALVRYAERLLGGLVTEVRPQSADSADSTPPPLQQTLRRAALARWETGHQGERPLPPSILWNCPVCREYQRTGPDVPALWCTGLVSAPHERVAMARAEERHRWKVNGASNEKRSTGCGGHNEQ